MEGNWLRKALGCLPVEFWFAVEVFSDLVAIADGVDVLA
jgi:hypothetical protein